MDIKGIAYVQPKSKQTVPGIRLIYVNPHGRFQIILNQLDCTEQQAILFASQIASFKSPTSIGLCRLQEIGSDFIKR